MAIGGGGGATRHRGAAPACRAWDQVWLPSGETAGNKKGGIMKLEFHYINFVSHDVDRLHDFYTQVLGLGDIPITKYETPGGQKFADTVKPFVKKSNVVILANHGTVSFGASVERAFWLTEILDATCRTVMLATTATVVQPK